jgi:hypothetical protein
MLTPHPRSARARPSPPALPAAWVSPPPSRGPGRSYLSRTSAAAGRSADRRAASCGNGAADTQYGRKKWTRRAAPPGPALLSASQAPPPPSGVANRRLRPLRPGPLRAGLAFLPSRAARRHRADGPGRRPATARALSPAQPPGKEVSQLSRRATTWSGLDCCTFFFVRCIFRNKKKSPTLHTASSASRDQKAIRSGSRLPCPRRCPRKNCKTGSKSSALHSCPVARLRPNIRRSQHLL